ncbi:MotA/TolQ/ExbB proton channel family protein [Oricola thermophila]|uniref:MotA/TolQ/ExbB proton channel family protein n=1 Tax=Oricola thermophila TaxID=2742145 RepID=A0A6N1VHU1_9HYPH|nr:MotA/TolQ/ExbB proton channel family protein [Oricola thermophila]QKV20378.1 MotA/TolQ/ExbB proton channel family protein [Oricola thermophila]
MIDGTLQRIADFLALGGPVVTVLVGVSVISAALVIAKIWQFLVERVGRHTNMDRALAHWNAGNRQLAISDLSASRSAAGALVRQGMATIAEAGSDEKDAVSERLQAEAFAYLARLQSGFRALDAIAQLSPLIGLFGTVLGMIEAFRSLQEAGNSVDPSLLAGGIWVALLTTAVGLAVAMPTSLFLTWFESRVARERELLARALTIILNPVQLAEPVAISREQPTGMTGEAPVHAA